jgi:hypothetical protein
VWPPAGGGPGSAGPGLHGTVRWARGEPCPHVKGNPMNNIIYLIGLIVVVLAVLAFLGLR